MVEREAREDTILFELKHKAIELKNVLEGIKLDGSVPWSDIAWVFHLASNSLQNLQAKLSNVLDHIVFVPDFNIHEDPSYVPNIISSQLLKEVEQSEEEAISLLYRHIDYNEDFEEKTRKFNDFCHELRGLVSNKFS